MKARGPAVGHAVVMQGRHVKHAALRAYNSAERITMVSPSAGWTSGRLTHLHPQVTSFRAKDPLVRDASSRSPAKDLWDESS